MGVIERNAQGIARGKLDGEASNQSPAGEGRQRETKKESKKEVHRMAVAEQSFVGKKQKRKRLNGEEKWLRMAN